MHPVSVSLQPFPATPASILVPRSAAGRNSIDFAELRRAGRSSGNLAMNSIQNPARGSETSGSEDFNVGDKDAVVIVDHGSRRQESNLVLNDFVEMFRARTGYKIVEPAHMDIMNDRIKYCLQHAAGNVDECTVCAGTGKCRLYS